MATYSGSGASGGGRTLNSVNGKAPSNAKVGDTIVTNGGSFKITGKNTDGSWKSEKVSNVSKNNYGGSSSGTTGGKTSGGGASGGGGYAGSAVNVGTYGTEQDRIKAQMNENSKAWYGTTDPAERARLHQENVELAKRLGGGVTYDGSTGAWSGMANAPQQTEPEGYAPTDNREYLEEMAAAYLEEQKAALKQAYESNVSDLQSEQNKLGANYQLASNQEASNNALARQRWNETAAAYGLNSGTAGQANLSYSTQLQSDLSTLQAAEAAADAEIEQQRTNLAKEYQSALAQAQAENDYQLYQKLYNEAVRIDQALQQQSQYNASLAMQQYQTALDQYNQDRSYRYTAEQNTRQDAYNAAALAAQTGDYSLYGKLYGWDEATIREMNQRWTALYGRNA